MTPENLKASMPLMQVLTNVEDMQLAASMADDIHMTIEGEKKRSIGIERGDAVMLFQRIIDDTKNQLRALGVVFETDDAVMPELRESGGVDAAPDHLTITIAGPKVYQKTKLAKILKWLPEQNDTQPMSLDDFYKALTDATILVDGQPVE